jgi:signal transduction histidine kinase
LSRIDAGRARADTFERGGMRKARTRLPHVALVASGLAVGVLTGSVLELAAGLAAAAILEVLVIRIAHRERWIAAVAVAGERRRLARELHDGLAQDLAFIATCGNHLATRDGGETLLRALSAAAAKALEETRGAIVGLDTKADEGLLAAVEGSSADLADRFGLEITVRGDGAGLSEVPRHDVLRLVREAVSNAARHGGARNVDVHLGGAGHGRMLCVRDDGTGFDPDRPVRRDSRGLRGMEERAARLGGRLLTRTRPEGGSEVVVLKGPSGLLR